MADIISINTDIYVPFGGDAIDFGEGAVVPAPEYPTLQYATGLPAQRPKLHADGFPQYDEETGEALMDNLYYAGFFTACGKDKELDEAMQKNKMPWINICHGSGEVVQHWMLERPALFIMAQGIPNNANSNGKYGMVYMWRQKRNSTTKNETVLYVQMVIRQLLPDYTKPFVFTMKSTQTTDALDAMRRQYKVLGKAHGFVGKSLPLWAYSALFGASKKQEQRGNSETSKTIFPMISGIPDEITAAYLQRHEVGLEYIEHFRKCTENTIEWAQGLTQRIASGVEQQQGDAGVEA